MLKGSSHRVKTKENCWYQWNYFHFASFKIPSCLRPVVFDALKLGRFHVTRSMQAMPGWLRIHKYVQLLVMSTNVRHAL